MADLAKPLPIPNPDTQPFWDGCARGELLLQRCSSCQAYRHPPSPRCQVCLSADHEWVQARGRGTLYSYVIVHHAFNPAWKDQVPYAVAIVELAEGPHMLSNVVDIPLERIAIGMALTVCFQRASEQIVLAKFRPAEA